MAFRIANNMASMNALRNLNIVNNQQASSMEKLSSGFRINRAADDAAGLAISEKMRAQISGLNQAGRNAQDGISLIQTAEGALDETHNILRRMRDLAVQSANDTNTNADRAQIQLEVDALALEVTRIAKNTEFNTMTLMDGTFSAADNLLTFHVGANAGQTIDLSIEDMTASALSVGAESERSVSTQAGANTAISAFDAAINTVSDQRARLGAVQNRLEHTIKNLAATEENLQASESRIRDTDMAAEMADMTKSQILSQAGTAMLAQANMQSQGVLSLLG